MDKVQKINKAYYERGAAQWAALKTHSFYSEKEFRIFEKYLKKGDRVLDIGCGHGRDVPLFLGIGRKLAYEGFDISVKFVETARSRYPQLRFYTGNILERKTLPRKKYDGFWAAASLQHIPHEDWPLMLENIEYLMRKGAVGYFSLPNDRSNTASKKDARHFTLLKAAEVRKIMKERGWKLLKTGKLPATRDTATWRWYIARIGA